MTTATIKTTKAILIKFTGVIRFFGLLKKTEEPTQDSHRKLVITLDSPVTIERKTFDELEIFVFRRDLFGYLKGFDLQAGVWIRSGRPACAAGLLVSGEVVATGKNNKKGRKSYWNLESIMRNPGQVLINTVPDVPMDAPLPDLPDEATTEEVNPV